MAAAVAAWARIHAESVSDSDIAIGMEQATAAFEGARYEEALGQFLAMKIPQCFPNRLAQKYHNVGLIHMKLGHSSEAEVALRRAVSYDAKDLDAYFLLARIAQDDRRYLEAIEYLHQAESQAQNGQRLPEAFRLLRAKLEELVKQPEATNTM
jgi:Tfp pilus assembly protein PilF